MSINQTCKISSALEDDSQIHWQKNLGELRRLREKCEALEYLFLYGDKWKEYTNFGE